MRDLKQVGRERYGLALVLILASMIFIMAAPEGRWSLVMSLALQGGALLAALRAAQSDHRLRIACEITVALALLSSITMAGFDTHFGQLFVRGASLVLVVVGIPIIARGVMRQVKDKQQITIHTMMGVLCIYLLMAMAFASGFGLIHEISDSPFFRQGDGADRLSNYLYFSLTTITTAGLGDFAPAENLGRSLTAAEALIGQIYLVTVVAVIVANLGRKR
ncbi:MAG TPA: potassium channel family protein [Solirubrobacterales bacterium]|nr:potassium channel family protein [Solirubrobacterales bacterium]